MRYDTVQTDITATLKQRIDAVFADPNTGAALVDTVDMPSNQKGFIQPYARPRITVGFEGSEAQDTNSLSMENQPELLKFNIIVGARELYGALGVHSLLAAVRHSLVGYEPVDCDRLALQAVELHSLEDGTFYYGLKFECSRLVVQNFFPLDAPEPILQELTYKTPFNGDIIVT